MKVRRIDPAHRYDDDDDREWPSVTGILGAVPPWLGRFDQVPADVLAYKQALGVAVHAAIAFDLAPLIDPKADGLDPESVDPAVLPRLAALRKYIAESGFRPRYVETVVWHPAYRYAGTLDLLGTIGPVWWLIDCKSSTEADADLAGPQTAGYLQAARETLPDIPLLVDRASLHLRADGTYRYVPHTSRADWDVFKAALILRNFAASRR